MSNKCYDIQFVLNILCVTEMVTLIIVRKTQNFGMGHKR